MQDPIKIVTKIIGWLIVSWSCHAQMPSAQMRHWGVSDGLPSEQISSIKKSKDGHLILATQRGLVRFDGYHFRTFPGSGSAPTCIIEYDGLIYTAGNSGGIHTYTHQTSHVLVAPNFKDADNNNDHFDNLYRDKYGTLWCTDLSGVKCFNTEGKQLIRVSICKNQNRPIRACFFEDLNGKLYLASEYGLFSCSKQNVRKTHTIAAFSSVMESNTGRILLLTDSTVVAYDSGNNQYETLHKLPKNFRPKGLCTSEASIFVFNDHTLLPIKTNEKTISVNDRVIQSVLYDSLLDCWWLGTNRGLLQINKAPSFIHYLPISGTKNESPKNIIQICRQNSGEMLCTDGHKLWHLKDSTDGEQWAIPGQPKIHHISGNNNQSWLISSDRGVWEWRKGKPLHVFAGSVFRWICAKRDGSYWCIDTGNQLHIYNHQWQEYKDRIKNGKEIADAANIWYQMQEDKHGNIWLAGYLPSGYGILKYDTVSRFFRQLSGLNPDSLFIGDYYLSLASNTNGQIMASGYGGFNLFDTDGKIRMRIGSDQYPLRSEHISNIADVGAGCIVAASPEGLHCVNTRNRNIVVLDQLAGLPFTDCSNGFSCDSATGQVWYGVNGTVVSVNVRDALKPHWQELLALTEVRADNKTYNNKDTFFQFEAGTRQIRLMFSAFTFADAHKTKYQYKINEGDWQQAEAAELHLIAPSAGTYDIVVRAVDNLDNKQEKQLRLRIKVDRYYYQTWWFSLMVLILLITGAIYSTNYISSRKRRIENLKRQVQLTEMQVLRSQMNPHFLFNALNALKSLILEGHTEQANEYLNKFSRLLRNILDNSTHPLIPLSLELKTLEWYIQLEQTRLENRFIYEINVESELDTEAIEVPPLIIQPFVENAIWHGIRPKKERGILGIFVRSVSGTGIEIEVQDNGAGRIQQVPQATKEPKSQKSLGIAITEERIKMINPKNKLEITDLHDPKGAPAGTSILITLYTEQ